MRIKEASYTRYKIQIGPIMEGVAAGLISIILFSLVIAVVLSATSLTEAYLPSLVNVFGLGSIFICGTWGGRRSQSLGWLHGAVSGIVFVLVIFVLSSLILPSNISFTTSLDKLAYGLILGGAGGAFGVNI